MATVSPPQDETTHQDAEQRFLIRGIDWVTYRKISEALTGRHFHMAYDGRNLELVTTSSKHGRLSRLTGQLIVVLAEETGLPRCSCGDMTCDRAEFERGLEPDECFYLKNEPLIRDKEVIDLAQDPPPDLAVEIDVSRSSINRLKIYAALRVPEVWRFNGDVVTMYHGTAAGEYAEADRSLHFPFLAPDDLAGFLRQCMQADETSLVKSFRAWVRERMGAEG